MSETFLHWRSECPRGPGWQRPKFQCCNTATALSVRRGDIEHARDGGAAVPRMVCVVAWNRVPPIVPHHVVRVSDVPRGLEIGLGPCQRGGVQDRLPAGIFAVEPQANPAKGDT